MKTRRLVVALLAAIVSTTGMLDAQSLRIDAPGAGRVVRVGESVDIEWSGIPAGTPAYVDVSIDNGRSWRPIGRSLRSGSMRWVVDGHSSEGALLRVRYDEPLSQPSPEIILRHSTKLSDARFAPDGRTIAAIGLDRTLRLWDATTGEMLWQRGTDLPVAFEVSQWARPHLYFSPDGSKIGVATRHPWGPVTELIDVATRRGIAMLDRVGYPARFIDETRIICPFGLYDLASSAWVVQFAGAHDYSTGFGLLPGGSEVVSTTCATGNLEYNSSATGARTRTISTDVALRPAGTQSPDGRYLATVAGNARLELRNIGDGTVVGARALPEGFPTGCVNTDVSFGPSGIHLAHALPSGAVDILDAVTLEHLFSTIPHGAAASSAAFSPDGNWIATSGHDNIVRITKFRDGEVTALSAPLRIDAADIHLFPAEREFDSVIAPATTGVTQRWTLASYAPSPLVLSPIGFRGAGASAFLLDSASVDVDRLVGPGREIEFNVGFRPPTVGRHDAELLVRAGDDTLTFAVGGLGVLQPIEARVREIDLGVLTVGESHDSVLADVVRNVDTVPHRVTVTMSTGDPQLTVVEGDGTFLAEPGVGYPLHVRFAPRSRSGRFRDTATIAFTAAGSPLAIVLIGQAYPRPSAVGDAATERRYVIEQTSPRTVVVHVNESFGGACSIRVVDIFGRVFPSMRSVPAHELLVVHLDDLPAGSYYVVAESAAHRTVMPIIVW
jgi:WD40 repeat protein